MSMSIISSKETSEIQIEGNRKRIESLEKESNLQRTIARKKMDIKEVQSNTERIECLEKESNLQRTIARKKMDIEEVQSNTERIECLEKELNLKSSIISREKKVIEEEVQSNTERIGCLEKELKEIRRIKDTIIDDLLNKIKDLENEIQALEERNKVLVKQLQEANERLKKIEDENKDKVARIEKLEKETQDLKACRDHDLSVLILVQIGTTLQRNRCKYVLGKDFKEAFFYKYGKINHYIETLVPARDQKSAKKRLKELEKKFPWDQGLVDSLKTLNSARIAIAHPELSSEEIQKATEYLKNEISDGMVKNIMKLKELWETLEDFLRRRSAP